MTIRPGPQNLVRLVVVRWDDDRSRRRDCFYETDPIPFHRWTADQQMQVVLWLLECLTALVRDEGLDPTVGGTWVGRAEPV